MNFQYAQPVWVLVAGDKVPGRISDPEVKPRTVATKRGSLNLNESVEVISYRKPPNAETGFYTRRAETAGFVISRHEPIPVVDGPKDANPTTEQLMAALDLRVGESMLALQKRLAAQADRKVNETDWTKQGATPLTL